MILFLFLHILELEHEIKITPHCEETSTAGDSHNLTCTVTSESPANLKWVRIINEEQVEVVNTSTITVSAQIVFDRITKRSFTFKPLLTSHAGKYKCVSVLNPGRVTDISWNGTQYKCNATTVGGRIVEKNFALLVKGHYF